ncbi:MAG: GNAT family N-acetyltransferase [Anaerovibrio sp.]|uniref:GNAT family N-acetyltransferase n=1 Tax=Anaerovibrio sp. TaxID=1872532 RepID=UPI0025D9AB43|nr:GNAT family N-acetyltransferase [Anaerovibrio sp.]MCR5177212.1 GNAT family N-acetyltransferase [Anaerovibrio sp.]
MLKNESLYLRVADENDKLLLFEWSNDPEVRKNSFNTDSISLPEHEQWLKNALADGNTLIYILMEKDIPVGQVRLVHGDCWQVNYSIAAGCRGKGYGKRIIHMAENELIQAGHAKERLYAEVRPDNVASQRIFLGLGYRQMACDKDAYAYEKVIGSS